MAARLELTREIAGTPEAVWAALTDLKGWKDWNPTLTYEDGELVVGTVVRMTLNLGKRKMAMRQTIVEVSPPSVLKWQSRFGPTWMFAVLRTVRISAAGPGRVTLEQNEVGTGLLARGIFVFTGRPTVKGYEAIADAIEKRVASSDG